jgi:hypothetical protein
LVASAVEQAALPGKTRACICSVVERAKLVKL